MNRFKVGYRWIASNNSAAMPVNYVFIYSNNCQNAKRRLSTMLDLVPVSEYNGGGYQITSCNLLDPVMALFR